jgi:tRNA(fMet)-specific endonuclease VapC
MERVIRSRYMLDTNTISHLVKQHPHVARHVFDVPVASLCMSTITAGELLYGLARRPDAVRLRAAVIELMRRVDVLPWDFSAAERYGILRADLDRAGRPLGSLDLLIAAQALAAGAVLVTNDRAFNQIPHLQIEDWTVDGS